MLYFVADKVGFVVDKGGGINGGDLAAHDILTCLRLAGHEVTVVSRRPRVALPERADGVLLPPLRWLAPPRYIAFPTRLDRRFVKRAAKWLIYNVQDLPRRYRFERQLQRDQPALVLFNDFPHPQSTIAKHLIEGREAALVVQMTPASFAFFEHSFDPDYTKAWVLAAIGAFRSLIFISDYAKNAWLSAAPLPTRTFVISNCCRENEAQHLLAQDKRAIREQQGLSPDDYLAVCVANVQPGKGQDLLVEALPHWVEAVPNFKLALVGRNAGAWAVRLRERVAELGLTDHVLFLGTRADAMAFTYAADVFVFPTHAEAQGIAVLEAMMLRTPVVATDTGGVSESVRDGEHGLLFPAGDVTSLTAAVLRLSEDPALGQRLAAHASARYWHHFSKAQQIERYGRALGVLLPS